MKPALVVAVLLVASSTGCVLPTLSPFGRACTAEGECAIGVCVDGLCLERIPGGGVDEGEDEDGGSGTDSGTSITDGGDDDDAGTDAGVDAGVDAGTQDAGVDAGTVVDAGPVDAGPDADGCMPLSAAGKSYSLCAPALTPAAAKQVCTRRGSRLLVLNDRGSQAANEEEENLVRAGAAAVGIDGFWLDLNDRVAENRFVWGDGAVLTRSSVDDRFATSQPARTGGEDCAVIRGDTSYREQACTGTTASVICEIPPGQNVGSGPNDCAIFHFTSTTITFVRCSGPRTRSGALAVCEQLHPGGRLPVVNDGTTGAKDRERLQTMMTDPEFGITTPLSSVWLSLNDGIREGTFTWSDGRGLEDYGIFNPAPDNAGELNCVATRGTSGDAWFTDRCDATRSYVCEK